MQLPVTVSDRRYDRATIAIHVISFAYSCLSLFRPGRDLTATFADDAAYYLQIARNFVEGYGWSFDKIHATNGFQPLWQYVLVGLVALFPVGPEDQIRLVGVIESVLLITAMWLVSRLVRKYEGPQGGLFASALFSSLIFFPTRQGMESSLLLLVGAVLMTRLHLGRRVHLGSFPAQVVTGTLLGLLMLARLDSVFWVAAILIAYIFTGHERDDGSGAARVLQCFVAGLVASIPVLVYLGFNLTRFGSIMPISGALKSSFPNLGWHYPTFILTPANKLVFWLASLVAIERIVQWLRKHPNGENHQREVATLTLAVGVLLHNLFTVFFMKWGVFGWHFVLSGLLLCLVLPQYFERALGVINSQRRSWLRTGAVLVLLALGSVFVFRRDWGFVARDSWRGGVYDMAMWCRTSLPENAILAMNDCGYLGLFSERRVVNLDGLVNGYEYQDSLKKGAFRGFLNAKNVGFIAHLVTADTVLLRQYDSLKFQSWGLLYDAPGGSVMLKRTDELFRSRDFSVGSKRGVAILWRREQ